MEKKIRATALVILLAMIAFEVFNYASTRQALTVYLGGLTILGLRWATVLAIGLCGIDLAGLARIATPEQDRDEPEFVWYLLGAWVVAALFNGWLTQVAVWDAMTANGTTSSGAYAMSWILAVVVVALRATLITLASHYGDNLLWAGSVTRRSTQPSAYQRQMSMPPTQRPGGGQGGQPGF